VRGELFVLRIDGVVMVKRLRMIGREIEVASDNDAYPTVTVSGGEADVIGRVVWLGRALL
jgi:phage repressor protein C with HTH and peptisase S24 domain